MGAHLALSCTASLQHARLLAGVIGHPWGPQLLGYPSWDRVLAREKEGGTHFPPMASASCHFGNGWGYKSCPGSVPLPLPVRCPLGCSLARAQHGHTSPTEGCPPALPKGGPPAPQFIES